MAFGGTNAASGRFPDLSPAMHPALESHPFTDTQASVGVVTGQEVGLASYEEHSKSSAGRLREVQSSPDSPPPAVRLLQRLELGEAGGDEMERARRVRSGAVPQRLTCPAPLL